MPDYIANDNGAAPNIDCRISLRPGAIFRLTHSWLQAGTALLASGALVAAGAIFVPLIAGLLCCVPLMALPLAVALWGSGLLIGVPAGMATGIIMGAFPPSGRTGWAIWGGITNYLATLLVIGIFGGCSSDVIPLAGLIAILPGIAGLVFGAKIGQMLEKVSPHSPELIRWLGRCLNDTSLRELSAWGRFWLVLCEISAIGTPIVLLLQWLAPFASGFYGFMPN